VRRTRGQGVAAFGLAGVKGQHRDRLGQGLGAGKQGAGLAGQQLQFQLQHGLNAFARHNVAHIQCNFDAVATGGLEDPGGAPAAGVEHRVQQGEQAAIGVQGVPWRLGQGCARQCRAVHHVFPFAPATQAALRNAGGLEGLYPFAVGGALGTGPGLGADAADAQRAATLAQGVLRGVVVAVPQPLALRCGRGQQRQACQVRLDVVRIGAGQQQLEFDFGGHGRRRAEKRCPQCRMSKGQE